MDPATPPPATPLPQHLARALLATALVLAGLWILREFIPALVWAGIFAIVLWPLYCRLLGVLPARAAHELAPAVLVLAVAVVFILPVVLLGIAVARESHFVVEFIGSARSTGIPVPDWIEKLPWGGPMIADWWRANLGDPTMAQELLGRLKPSAELARHYGSEIAHRLVLFGFTLLTLFFLFRDGAFLANRLRALSDRLLGHHGEHIASQMIAAVHGTVTGLVLVGLAEGVILGVVYFAVGLPYPASVGAVTGIAAVIPFAAPIVFGVAALYLVAQGAMVQAIVVVVAGTVVVFVADHAVRPFLIGGAARLPFLWVLLGILGGLSSLGFLGLFLGPAIMAALIALWREWTDATPLPPGPDRLPAPRRRPTGRRVAGRRG